jgi:molybdopterin biosynthesis enzyme MoaB
MDVRLFLLEGGVGMSKKELLIHALDSCLHRAFPGLCDAFTLSLAGECLLGLYLSLDEQGMA